MIVGAKTTARFLGVIFDVLVLGPEITGGQSIPGSRFLYWQRERDGRLKTRDNRDAWEGAY
jgi:hypothetical protein